MGFSAKILKYNPLWGWFNADAIMATLGLNWGLLMTADFWTTYLFFQEQTKVKLVCLKLTANSVKVTSQNK